MNIEILTPQDLTGKTISQIRKQISEGAILSPEAQHCFERAIHRIKVYVGYYSEVLTEEIAKIEPAYISDKLKNEIRASSSRLFSPMVTQHENRLIMKFPAEGLRSSYTDEQNIFDSGKVTFRSKVVASVQIFVDAVEGWVLEDGPEFLDTLPNILNTVPVPNWDRVNPESLLTFIL